MFTCYSTNHLFLNNIDVYIGLLWWLSTKECRRLSMQEMWVQSLGYEDPVEKEMVSHSTILAWKIPWTGAFQTTVHGVAKTQTQPSD